SDLPPQAPETCASAISPLSRVATPEYQARDLRSNAAGERSRRRRLRGGPAPFSGSDRPPPISPQQATRRDRAADQDGGQGRTEEDDQDGAHEQSRGDDLSRAIAHRTDPRARTPRPADPRAL